jgi:SAM-dependent methyltransferase
MREWVAFWNKPNSIYVNERHRDAHYRVIAERIRMLVRERDGASPAAAARTPLILDYGCGEALHAKSILDDGARLILSDAAPTVRDSLAHRFAGEERITVRSPEEVAAMPDASLDFIFMVSVAQYLASQELDEVLRLFRRLLKPDGKLFIADVIPPSVPALVDASELLRFGWSHGFLLASLTGLVRTAFSDYRVLRSRIGLSVYDEAAITERLRAVGFDAMRHPMNIGHNPNRMTFLGRPNTAMHR